MPYFKTLFKNIFGLGSINIINLIIPIIIIPILSRTISSNDYGYILYITTLQLFSAIFLDYSFNITSVKEYITSNNKVRRNVIFIETQLSRLLLMLIYSFIVLFYTIMIGYNIYDIIYYIIPFSLAHILISPWLYQAKCQLSIMGTVLFFSRVVHLILILVYKDNKNIDSIVLISQTYTYLLSGLILFYISRNNYILCFKSKRKTLVLLRVKEKLLNSLPLFIADFSPNLYTNIPAILLIDFINKAIYFQYNIAIKVVGIGLMLQSIISRAFFPILCKDKNINQKIVFCINILPTLLFITPTILFSNHLFFIITGQSSILFQEYMVILSIGMFFGVLGSYLGQNFLLVKTDGRKYSKVIVISCVISGIIGLFIVPIYTDFGAIWLLTIGRFFFFIGCFYCFLEYKRQQNYV
ncbi:oligosaccharide flippase family protein [Proteus penneri]|uniref:Wzx n=1 Tax=Proteus penneri TaxID=102862 RepID=A0A385JNI9_9GAMM|nr:oligosaccharide flippase family protein [Proteus penneri]AXY99940.1 wzx [Proteus penneri]